MNKLNKYIKKKEVSLYSRESARCLKHPVCIYICTPFLSYTRGKWP